MWNFLRLCPFYEFNIHYIYNLTRVVINFYEKGFENFIKGGFGGLTDIFIKEFKKSLLYMTTIIIFFFYHMTFGGNPHRNYCQWHNVISRVFVTCEYYKEIVNGYITWTWVKIVNSLCTVSFMASTVKAMEMNNANISSDDLVDHFMRILRSNAE